MKNFVVLFSLILLFSDCGGGGVSGKGGSKKGFEAQPENMVLINSGSFEMGSNDEDVVWAMNAPLRRRTTDVFWMDQTETTNLAYRTFVAWTADSVARRALAAAGEDGFVIEQEDEDEDEEYPPLNYKTKVAPSGKKDVAEDHNRALKDAGYYYSKKESMGKKNAIDVRTLTYEYQWVDLYQAAKAKWDPKEKKYTGTVTDMNGETTEIVDRSSFIIRHQVLVYPDTLVWIRDFHNSYNEPMAVSYFSHPGYDYYPVVGVTWEQAKAFCHWRSNHAEEKRYRNQYAPHSYRLPMEVEYEYAARGGLEGNLYPWGSLYNTNKSGCYLANFKPQRGDYALDGFSRIAPIAQYEPNEYGLYDMAGNVAEWVYDAYDENSYEATHDLVPVYHRDARPNDKNGRKRKVIRGGSWKDFAYFLQCGARDYEYQDSARSFIGFRTVRDAFLPGQKPVK
ncbi:MAG: formylglycine-generating enzyme family protein [Prevotellaceae bacterium]|jgi:formylglycine-generating enzyme required for sulfatase activity|nr:formylglycine-generating enzyme family protein [Prevotellaceae bacterium]